MQLHTPKKNIDLHHCSNSKFRIRKKLSHASSNWLRLVKVRIRIRQMSMACLFFLSRFCIVFEHLVSEANHAISQSVLFNSCLSLMRTLDFRIPKKTTIRFENNRGVSLKFNDSSLSYYQMSMPV